MKMWQGMLLLVVGVFVGFLATQSFSESSKDQSQAAPTKSDEVLAGPTIGMKAPDFSLIGLDGKTYRLSDLKGDKPVLINFWASWCPPCKAEAPDLVKMYEKYQDDIEIYGVNLTASDTRENAQKFVEEYGFAFPVLLDENAEIGQLYQAFSIPTSYFVDRNGNIQNKMIGITSPEELEKMIKRLISVK